MASPKRTNLNDTTPAAPAGKTNVKWQADSLDPRDASAYMPTATASVSGAVPAPPNDATKFLDGTANFDTVKDSDLSTSDITTNDATSSKHGFLLKLSGSASDVLKGDGTWGTGSGGGGSTSSVTQTTHGFAVQDAIYYTGSAWAKAKADANTTLGLGIVVAVADADNFTVQFSGPVTGLSGLTAGEYYFVDDSTAGLLSATEPTTVGHYSNPLLFATSTTAGVVLPFRPSAIQVNTSPTVTGVKTGNYTAAGGETVLVDPSGGGFSVTLPSASSVGAGVDVTVKNMTTSTNTMTFARSGSDVIDGAASSTAAGPYFSATFRSDGSSNWMVV